MSARANLHTFLQIISSAERADAISTWGCIIQTNHERRVIDQAQVSCIGLVFGEFMSKAKSSDSQ
jgi:hypothetical protein